MLFSDINISQGSVVTRFGAMGYLMTALLQIFSRLQK